MYPIGEESYFMLEGDTVTVLGHLKYNFSQETLEFDNPIAMFMGGKTDYINTLVEEQRNYFYNVGLGIIFLSLSLAGRYLVMKATDLNNPSQQMSDKV